MNDSDPMQLLALVKLNERKLSEPCVRCLRPRMDHHGAEDFCNSSGGLQRFISLQVKPS